MTSPKLSDMPMNVLEHLMPYLSDHSRSRLKLTNSKFHEICTKYEKTLQIHPKCRIEIEWNTCTSWKPANVANTKHEDTNLVEMTPESCPFFLTKQLIILRVNSDWYKPSLAPEIMNFSLFTAPVLESLYLHNILLKKSWLFNLLEKSENLKVLSITNCYINEAVNVGTELLPVIPKVSSLTLVETPEFSTDKNTAKLLKNHVLKNGKFEQLKIDPFYPFKTQKEIKNLEGICNSVVEISHFHGLFCNRVLSCLGYRQKRKINGVHVDYSRNTWLLVFLLFFRLFLLLDCVFSSIFVFFTTPNFEVSSSIPFLIFFPSCLFSLLLFFIFYNFYFTNSSFWCFDYRFHLLLSRSKYPKSAALSSRGGCFLFFLFVFFLPCMFSILPPLNDFFFVIFATMNFNWLIIFSFAKVFTIFIMILIQKKKEYLVFSLELFGLLLGMGLTLLWMNTMEKRNRFYLNID